MSDLREIDGVYSDAKLKSRFKVLERNLNKDISKTSHSVEPDSKFRNKSMMFANDDKSIQQASQNLIILKGTTHRSRVNDGLDHQNKPNYKNHVKRMVSLKKHIYVNSKSSNSKKIIGNVSDYGVKRNQSTHPRGNIELGYQTQDSNLKLMKSKGSIGSNLAKEVMSKTIMLDDKDSSDSEAPIEYNDSEVDITEITKNVLEKWGVVRKMK